MEYRVLARKYRPKTFDDLIGQEVLVRTLSNAIASGRIAHGFLLTGIRGIGKTTTARIIARALNCVGADGQGGPTIHPCGVCPHCVMIMEDRDVDVLEMDAASHTGVGDMRDLIDSARYLPSAARYKIYIIDEVHMLSNSAFNALLKTLEEPPPHVKFIFATTEVKKIPVTILSRCQRFDLKRIERTRLAEHLAAIAGKEDIQADVEALQLIATAAEGSVRDALSLLDQAISQGNEKVTADQVRQMLGNHDNTAVFRLLELVLNGQAEHALDELGAQYYAGGDPLSMLQELLQAVHLITRAKISEKALQDPSLSQHDRETAARLATELTMPILARLWQMFLKGIGELRLSPQPFAALEMLFVRVAYASSLPTPQDAIKSVDTAAPTLAAVQTAVEPSKPKLASPRSFAEAVQLFEKNREALLYNQLKRDAHLITFSPGAIELRIPSNFPRDFAARIAGHLQDWTGEAWKITLSEAHGEPSLEEHEQKIKEGKLEQASSDSLVASMLEEFPGAKLVGVK